MSALSGLDLRSLEVFAMLAETRSFRVAAERLGMSQPALSMRLMRLKGVLEMRLMNRSRASVTLSPEGAALLPHVARALGQVEGVREAAVEIVMGREGRLRIGYTPVSLRSYVPALIAAFSDAHQSVETVLIEDLSREVETGLAQGMLDVGFLHPPIAVEGLTLASLPSERYVAAMTSDDPLAVDHIQIGDLAERNLVLVGRAVGPHLYDRIVSTCRRAGFEPRIRQKVMTSNAVLALIAAGQGIGLVIEGFRGAAPEGVVFRDLLDGDLDLPFALAYRTDAREKLVATFISDITARCADPGWSARGARRASLGPTRGPS